MVNLPMSVPLQYKISGPTFPQSRFVVRCHVTTWVAAARVVGPIWPPPGTSQHPPGLLTVGEKDCCRSGQVWDGLLASPPPISLLFTPSNPPQPSPFPPQRGPLPAQLIPAQRGDLRTRARESSSLSIHSKRRRNPTSHRMTNNLGIWPTGVITSI